MYKITQHGLTYHQLLRLTTPYCAAGLAATSVQWGAWGGIGMVAHSAAVLGSMRRAGIDPVMPAQGLTVLRNLLRTATAPRQARLHLLCDLFQPGSCR